MEEVHGALDSLRVIPLDATVPHEACDPRRLEGLAREMRRDGVQRHPIAVLPTSQGGYLILDGHHRAAALRALGCPCAVAQVADAAAPGFSIRAWQHWVPALELRQVVDAAGLKAFRALPDAVRQPGYVATVAAGAETVALLSEPADLSAVVAGMNRLCRLYSDAPYRRVAEGSGTGAGGGVLVAYRSVTLEEIMELTQRGQLLPAGCSRFVLPYRVLNVRTPISLLNGPEDVPKKDLRLRAWVRRWLQGSRARQYDSPVIIIE